MPLLLLAYFPGGNRVAYFDETLEPGLQVELVRRIQNITFPQIDPLLDFIKEQNLQVETGHYKTYLFPALAEILDKEGVTSLSSEDPMIQAFGFGGFAERVYVIEQDRKIVSACVSARENDFCGEAWVFTEPAFRHHGMAQKVVGAWARHMIRTEKVPFYSHKIENTASAHLAARLRLEPVFEEIVISYMNV